MESKGPSLMSRELRRLAENSSWIFAAYVAANASSVIMNWLLVKSYGKEAHSQITIMISIVTTVTLVADLGLASKSGIRQLARLREKTSAELEKYLSSVLLLLVGLAFFFSGWLAILSPAISTYIGISKIAVIMLSIWVFGNIVFRAYVMIAIGFEEMRYLIFFTTISQVLLCSCAFVSLVFSLNLIVLFSCWTFVWIVAIISGAIATRQILKLHSIRLSRDFQPMSHYISLIKGTVAYFVPALCSTGLPSICFMLIGSDVGDDLSILQVSFSLALVGQVISQPLSIALFPILSRSDAKGDDKLTTGIMIHQVNRALCMIMILVFIGTWSLGEIVLTAYLPEYTEGIYALILFTVAVAIEGYKSQLDQALMASKYVNVTAFLEIAKLLLVAIGIKIWAPLMGLLALPTVLIGATLIVTTVRVVLVNRLFRNSGYLSTLAMLVSFFLISAVALIFKNPLYAILVGVPLIFLFRFITFSELTRLYSTLKNRWLR